MNTTITVRNLDETVKQQLRIRAAEHGQSMEAEVREILTRSLLAESVQEPSAPAFGAKGKFEHLAGIWKNRGTTDDLMRATRGED